MTVLCLMNIFWTKIQITQENKRMNMDKFIIIIQMRGDNKNEYIWEYAFLYLITYYTLENIYVFYFYLFTYNSQLPTIRFKNWGSERLSGFSNIIPCRWKS